MSKSSSVKITAYLKKRGGEKWLNYDLQSDYQLIIVIPSIAESENLPTVINSLNNCLLPKEERVLVIVVVNNSVDASQQIISDNASTIDYLKQIKESGKLTFDIEYIDASSGRSALPAKDAGVGLARKIGMDQALLRFDYTKSNLGIVCLDADCEVDKNYLEELTYFFRKNNRAAGVIRYRHKLTNEAIICYEIFLHYYILGLKHAGSPYAHHSIGSCIVIDPYTYVKIDGMNKQKAGEDFYFLEKAAKVIDISQIDSTTVYPSERKSWRVPFGTGQRMTRFVKEVKDEYMLYNPESFIILKKFLIIYTKKVEAAQIVQNAKSISPALFEFLIINKLEENLKRILQNSKTDEQFYHQKKIWFDGFKTMKLIHYLRDNGYPDIPMFTALNRIFDLVDQTFEKDDSKSLPSIEKQIEYLEQLRELT